MQMNHEISYSKDYTVAIANSLIRGRQTMTILESRLLYIAISQVVKQDKDFKIYTTTIPELARFLEVPTKNLYRDIDSITDNLMKRFVKIKQSDNEWEKFQWVSSCNYKNGIITIKLSDEIKPYLIALEKYYSQYMLGTLISFKSYYTSRLYQLILCELREKNVSEIDITFTVEDLRELFQIDKKKYPRVPDLLKKTVYVARDELAKKSDVDAVIIEVIENKAKTRGTPIESVTIRAESRH